MWEKLWAHIIKTELLTWNSSSVDIRPNDLLQLMVGQTLLEAHVQKFTQVFCQQI